MIILVFLLPALSGGLLAHVLWPDREMKYLLFKAFLGVGIGLGINSLAYFVYMSFFAGQHWFFLVQIIMLLALLSVSLWRERTCLPREWSRRILTRPSRLQTIFLALAAIVLLVSLSSTASYILRRRQGDWDAWMMYNRAARFVYRDQVNWLGSFSSQMDPIFHADYPLLLAMNIASSWDTLGSETPHVPMAQSALFAVACAGLFVSGLACMKSVGQAALGLIVLWGTPAVVNEGARELADLPLAYFFLATAILIYLYVVHRQSGLLILAGLTAGLAAWVKNEGSVFVIAGILAVAVTFLRERPWRALLWYGAGVAAPLAIVLYFKLFLAPPSDVLSSGPARSLAQALELSRHLEILQFFGRELLTFGGWSLFAVPVGVIAVLLVYLLLARGALARDHVSMVTATAVLLAVQLLGYYAVYVITPYDLTWHLNYSIERIFLQMFPLIAFAVLTFTQTPETIFRSN